MSSLLRSHCNNSCKGFSIEGVAGRGGRTLINNIYKKVSTVFLKFFWIWNVRFQKISILPPQKGLEIPGTMGVSKNQKFKALYEAKVEFPERWGGGGGGGHRANP